MYTAAATEDVSDFPAAQNKFFFLKVKKYILT